MATLELSTADLLRCRFAISPVSEVVEVARTIANPSARAAHGRWLGRQREALQRIATANDLRPLLALLAHESSTPDFLRPVPDCPVAEIDRELEQIRSAADRALRSAAAAGLLADVLASLWTGLVQPSWRQIRGCLDRDILYHHTIYWRTPLGEALLRGVIEMSSEEKQRREIEGPALILRGLC